MTGYSSVQGTSAYAPAERVTLLRPTRLQPHRRAVLFAHGANGTGADGNSYGTQPTMARHAARLAAMGHVVLAADFGGAQAWGNDAALASCDAAWTWLKGTGWCATDKVLFYGASMGYLTASRFAADRPASVAALVGMIPALEPEDLRTRDAIATREPINTAWGLPAGSFVGGAVQTPVPARGRPLTRTADVAGIPTRLYYSTGDNVTRPQYVVEYAAARGADVVATVTSNVEHSDPPMAAANVPQLLAFLEQNGQV